MNADKFKKAKADFTTRSLRSLEPQRTQRKSRRKTLKSMTLGLNL